MGRTSWPDVRPLPQKIFEIWVVDLEVAVGYLLQKMMVWEKKVKFKMFGKTEMILSNFGEILSNSVQHIVGRQHKKPSSGTV